MTESKLVLANEMSLSLFQEKLHALYCGERYSPKLQWGRRGGTGLSRSRLETFQKVGWFRGEWKKQLARFLSCLGEGQLSPD